MSRRRASCPACACLACASGARRLLANRSEKPPEIIRPVLSMVIEPQTSADIRLCRLGRAASQRRPRLPACSAGSSRATSRSAISSARHDDRRTRSDGAGTCRPGGQRPNSPMPRRNSPTPPPARTASASCWPPPTPRRPSSTPRSRQESGRSRGVERGEGGACQIAGAAGLRPAVFGLRRGRHRGRRRGRPDGLARPDRRHRGAFGLCATRSSTFPTS